jgi:hypothetical protein
MLFTRCLTDRALMYGSLNDASAEVDEVAPSALENLELSPKRDCLLEWDESTITVGRVDSAEIETTEVASGAIRSAGFSPDGTQIVWTDENAGVYRRPVEGCSPKGESVLVLETSGTVSQAVFLPRQQ